MTVWQRIANLLIDQEAKPPLLLQAPEWMVLRPNFNFRCRVFLLGEVVWSQIQSVRSTQKVALRFSGLGAGGSTGRCYFLPCEVLDTPDI